MAYFMTLPEFLEQLLVAFVTVIRATGSILASKVLGFADFEDGVSPLNAEPFPLLL